MGRSEGDGRDPGSLQSIDQGKYLTGRQDQVIRLAMNGMSSKEIARHLGISKRTVDAHFDKARERLGVANRNALVSIMATAETNAVDDGREPCPFTGSLHAVVAAKDEQIAALTADMEASLERERWLELRLAELERRLSTDSTECRSRKAGLDSADAMESP